MRFIRKYFSSKFYNNLFLIIAKVNITYNLPCYLFVRQRQCNEYDVLLNNKLTMYEYL